MNGRAIHYSRDPRCEQGCVSDRHDLAAPSGEESETEAIEVALVEAGFTLAQAELAGGIFAEFAGRNLRREAATMVCELLRVLDDSRVGKTPEFTALKYLLSGGRSLTEVAEEAGLPRKTVAHYVERFRPFFAARAA